MTIFRALQAFLNFSTTWEYFPHRAYIRSSYPAERTTDAMHDPTPVLFGQQSHRLSKSHSCAGRLRGLAAWLVLSSILAATGSRAQSASMEESILLSAVATNSSITLTAPAFSGTTAYTIYRKLRSDADFPGSPLATIPVTGSTDLNYEDTGISPNVLYEYKVVRTAASTGYGYICSGYQVPASAWADNTDHYMGKVLVLTESGLSTSISTELAQLAADLKADGWVPLMDNSVNSTDDPDDVRELIVDAHTNDPTLKAVLLIGRIPVPLAQNNSIDPDAHNITNRLWPLMGTMVTWTELGQNTPPGRTRALSTCTVSLPALSWPWGV